MTRDRRWLVAIASIVALVLEAPTAAWSQSLAAVAPGDVVRLQAPARIVIPGLVTLEDGRVETRRDHPIARENEGDFVVLRDGDRTVHLPRPGRRATGRLVGITDEELILRGAGERTIRVPREAVERLEVRRGGGTRKVGALVGAAVAMAAGYALGYAAEKDCGGWCFPEVAGVGAGLLLALPGAVAGAALGSAAEKWVPVAPEGAKVAIVLRPSGASASVSIRF